MHNPRNANTDVETNKEGYVILNEGETEQTRPNSHLKHYPKGSFKSRKYRFYITCDNDKLIINNQTIPVICIANKWYHLDHDNCIGKPVIGEPFPPLHEFNKMEDKTKVEAPDGLSRIPAIVERDLIRQSLTPCGRPAATISSHPAVCARRVRLSCTQIRAASEPRQ